MACWGAAAGNFLISARWSVVHRRRNPRPLRANIPETSLVPLINEQGEKEKGRDALSWCSFFWGVG